MTFPDSKSRSRTARPLLVEARRASGSPPSYGNWRAVASAKVDRIEINAGARSSSAVIWLPDSRWDYRPPLLAVGSMVRIASAEPSLSARSVIFQGFVTGYRSGFSGGAAAGPAEPFSASHERCGFVLADYRWLLSATSPVFGQAARGPDDYDNFGTGSQSPKSGKYTWLTGRRCIFNAGGRPDRDPEYLSVASPACSLPLFTDPDRGEYWTARDMLYYLLSPFYNRITEYLPIGDPADLVGLDDDDFDAVLSHVVADRLSIPAAVDLICRQLGWSFREQYSISSDPDLVFFKTGSALRRPRNGRQGYSPCILHDLHAPAAGEDISSAVASGKKMLWSMSLVEDIAPVVNKPVGLGAPHRFEFTAQLVPAWGDADLLPDTSESLANLFFTDAQLQDMADPNAKSFYKYYHSRGSGFLRTVGRRWSLNESGRYSPSPFDRGAPFDFSQVISAQYVLDDDGRRLYGPFNRQLLPCLTRDKDSLTSVGIGVEFSFDSGATWQVIPCSIASLPDEAGILIAEPNLADMLDEAGGSISGGALDGVELNYYTSLADDKLNSRVFKNNAWHTRCRVTASVQMDRRLLCRADQADSSGSPFEHCVVEDFSDRYGLIARSASSQYYGGDLSAYQVDSTDRFDRHLAAIRRARQDPSISGLFVLERLWLGDGAGEPDFLVGDGIDVVTGRAYRLARDSESGIVYPEIIRILYLPDEQKQELVTRDLRFVEVPV